MSKRNKKRKNIHRQKQQTPKYTTGKPAQGEKPVQERNIPLAQETPIQKETPTAVEDIAIEQTPPEETLASQQESLPDDSPVMPIEQTMLEAAPCATPEEETSTSPTAPEEGVEENQPEAKALRQNFFLGLGQNGERLRKACGKCASLIGEKLSQFGAFCVEKVSDATRAVSNWSKDHLAPALRDFWGKTRYEIHLLGEKILAGLAALGSAIVGAITAVPGWIKETRSIRAVARQEKEEERRQAEEMRKQEEATKQADEERRLAEEAQKQEEFVRQQEALRQAEAEQQASQPQVVDNQIEELPGKKKKKKRKHPVLRGFLITILVLGFLSCAGVCIYVADVVKDLPTITAEDLKNAQTSYVYDEDGNQIAELHGAENRTSVSIDQMPQHLLDALVASEDIRFYEHHGVDIRAIFRAIKVDLIDSIQAGELTFTQGASTITMQLVKNVVDERDKTIPRKIKQAALALQFEKNYSKEDILYYYLNEIYLGPQVYGVQAASKYYFNKDVSEINLQEAATLIAVLRAPSYYDPYNNPDEVVRLRNVVVDSMIVYDPDTYGESALEAMASPLVVDAGTEESHAADYRYPWYVDTVISECEDILEEMGEDTAYVYTGGLRIYTALDPDVQQALDEIYADESNFPQSNTGDIVESAMVIVEPNTGEIKGLVGGRVYTALRGYNRATDLKRSPGSTIKPLVAYGPAIELGYGSGYVLDDSPVRYGDWEPKNDGGGYMGRVTMRRAVASSRNICAVKMLAEIGTTTGWEYGNRLGLDLVDTDDNLSLTLGGLTYGVSPLQMAAAFATFASKGVYTEPYTITRIETASGTILYTAEPEQDQVFSEATAYIMTDILHSVVTSGTGTNARISGWYTAGKTGTNGVPSGKDDPDYAGISGNKDVWFCGYTSALVGAVWLGYDDKKDDDGNMQYLSGAVYGGNYAARLFNKVMTKALVNY